jgi:hypothetical protein
MIFKRATDAQEFSEVLDVPILVASPYLGSRPTLVIRAYLICEPYFTGTRFAIFRPRCIVDPEKKYKTKDRPAGGELAVNTHGLFSPDKENFCGLAPTP